MIKKGTGYNVLVDTSYLQWTQKENNILATDEGTAERRNCHESAVKVMPQILLDTLECFIFYTRVKGYYNTVPSAFLSIWKQSSQH